MSKIEVKKKKKLHEVRLYMEGDYLGKFMQLAVRFGCLLREEFEYMLAEYDNVHILCRSSLEESIVFDGVKKTVSSRIFFVTVTFPALKSDESSLEYWTNLVATILSELAMRSGSDTKAIETCRSILVRDESDTIVLMTSKIRKTERYIIEPSFKVKGLYTGNGILLFVKIKDLRTGIERTRLIAECSLYELWALADSFAIKNDELILKAKKSAYTESYRRRGFAVPVRIPLSQFFTG